MSALKFDYEKPNWSLIPWNALLPVVRVLENGAEKYGKHNWKKGMKWSRLISATYRHLHAFTQGQDIDVESKLPHLAHAICNLLFLSDYWGKGVGDDDRNP